MLLKLALLVIGAKYSMYCWLQEGSSERGPMGLCLGALGARRGSRLEMRRAAAEGRMMGVVRACVSHCSMRRGALGP